MNSQEMLDKLSNHRSIRFFDDRKVNEETLLQLLSVAQTASTSSNLQAYSIVKVDDAQKRQEIAKIAGNQAHVVQAPVFLVFCGDLYRLKAAGELEDKEFNTDYLESFLVSAVDTAIVAQNFLAAAELTGLGGVYIGGIRNDMKRMIELLELPPYSYPLFGMCIGYPDANKMPDKKPRFPLQFILHQDQYDTEKTREAITEYNQIMKDYYNSRDSSRRDITWSSHLLKEYSKPRRTTVKESLKQQKLGLE